VGILATLRRVLGVALFIAAPISKEWSSHVLRLASSLWIVVPFYAFGGEVLAGHALVGALVNTVFSVCIFSAYEETLYALQGLRDLFLASPLTSLEYRVGLSLGILITAIPSIAICSVPLIAMTKCGPQQVALLIALIIALWAISTLIGYLIPVRRNPLATGNMIRLLSLALIAIPPVYYPISAWPGWLRPIAYAIPTFNIAQLMKMILGIESQKQLATVVTALVVEDTIISLMAIKRTKST